MHKTDGFDERSMSTDNQVKRIISALQTLAKAKPRVRNRVLTKASDDLVSYLLQLAKLILSGDIQLTKFQYNTLKNKHQAILRRFVSDSTRPVTRKNIIRQKGGFIGILLKPLIGAVGSLLQPLFNGLAPPPRR